MEGNSKAFKLFCFFKYSSLALLPILSIYKGFHFIDLGLWLLLGTMLVEIIIKKGHIEINVGLFIILVFFGALNIVLGFLHTNVMGLAGYMNNSIGMFFFAVVYAYFIKTDIVQKDVFYRYIKMVALASSFFLFVQYYFYTKGVVVSGFLPLESESFKDYLSVPIAYGRPNSFFLEPAHFAIYVLPVFVLSLIKNHYVTSAILLVALFLSTSSTGIVIALIVAVYFFVRENRIPIIIKWILALAGLTAIMQFIPYIKLDNVLDKLTVTSLKQNIRVFGTLGYFRYFSATELLFGVGLNQIQTFIKIFAQLNIKNYSNAFLFSFLSFGLIGGVIWNAYVLKLYSLSKNKLLYIVFILIYFSDQLLFNRNLFYMLLILFVYAEKGEEPTKQYGFEESR